MEENSAKAQPNIYFPLEKVSNYPRIKKERYSRSFFDHRPCAGLFRIAVPMIKL